MSINNITYILIAHHDIYHFFFESTASPPGLVKSHLFSNSFILIVPPSALKLL